MDQQAVARQRWLKERRSGIGGSDAAAVLGLSPWRTPMEVWLDKQGHLPDQPQTEQQWWGAALEDVVAQRYARDTGSTVWNPERLYHHPEHDCLIATPDRIAISAQVDGKRGLEVKTDAGFGRNEWGPAGSDHIPQHYLLQCVHYMAVTGLDRWDVAVLIGGSDFRIYTIHRDRELEAEVVERLRDWWHTHMEKGVQPDLDGSEGVRQWLARRFPHEKQAAPIVATPAMEQAALWLADARVREDAAVADRDKHENAMKLLLAENVGAIGDGWRATWKAAKPRRTTDWKAVALQMRGADPAYNDPYWSAIVDAHTTEAPAVRRFVFTITTAGRELTP